MPVAGAYLRKPLFIYKTLRRFGHARWWKLHKYRRADPFFRFDPQSTIMRFNQVRGKGQTDTIIAYEYGETICGVATDSEGDGPVSGRELNDIGRQVEEHLSKSTPASGRRPLASGNETIRTEQAITTTRCDTSRHQLVDIVLENVASIIGEEPA